MGARMQFFLGTSATFPHGLRLRLFALCLVASHLPLLSYLIWGAATGRIASAELIILVLATWAGAAIIMQGTGALLEAVDGERGKAVGGSAMPGPATGSVVRMVAGRMRRMRRPETQQDIAEHEDPLTGLLNRRGLLEQLDALPPQRRQGCIALIDIDRLVHVRESQSSGEADRLLGDVAARLSAQVRRIDLVARWGETELAIYYQDALEEEASWSLARIAERMRQEPVGRIEGHPLTFSAGLCRWRGEPIAAAIYKAKAALGNARSAGGDQIQRAGGASLRGNRQLLGT